MTNKKMTNSEKFDYLLKAAVVLLVILLFTKIKVSTYNHHDGTITTVDFYGNVEVEHNISYSEYMRRKN